MNTNTIYRWIIAIVITWIIVAAVTSRCCCGAEIEFIGTTTADTTTIDTSIIIYAVFDTSAATVIFHGRPIKNGFERVTDVHLKHGYELWTITPKSNGRRYAECTYYDASWNPIDRPRVLLWTGPQEARQ